MPRASRSGGTLDQSGSSKADALVEAAANGDIRLAKDLIADGAEVNALGTCAVVGRKGYKLRALIAATSFGQISMVRLLLKSGADPSLTCTDRMRALDEARVLEVTSPKKAERICQLLEEGAAHSSSSGGRASRASRAALSLKADSATTLYVRALTRLGQLTGEEPEPISTRHGKLPGGVRMQEKRARRLVEQHQAEFLKKGAYLFFTRDLLTRAGHLAALLPARDAYAAIAAIGTNGANDDVSNADVIEWLRCLAQDEDVRITGIGTDFVEGSFSSPLHDPARRVAEICPEARNGDAALRRQSAHLQKTRRLLLWWD